MSSGETTPDAGPLTVEDLARRVGMTVRNVRAYRSRGLLPPPRRRGRRGYYGAEHVERLREVHRLQGDGFNLAAIAAVLDTPVGRPGVTALLEEGPVEVEQADLPTAWGGGFGSLLAEATEMGLVEPLATGRYRLPSPALAQAAAELQRAGVPGGAIRDAKDALARGARDAADAIAAAPGAPHHVGPLVAELLLAGLALHVRSTRRAG